MNLRDNGLFKFDYQFPVYNFFFPTQGKRVFDENINDILGRSNFRINSRALYFHIPFCETICSFCPFTRGAYRDHDIVDKYVNALIKEIEIKSKINDYFSIPVKAIFFGGGTPSLLSPDNMIKIGEAIKKYFLLSKDCEFSFEIEIKSLSSDKVFAMKEMGVTHPRFGLQTFDPNWRKLFNLTSTYEQINFAADLLNKNFKTVLFDILYGMNGQDEEELIRDLEKAIALGTSNIDIYPIDNVMTQAKLHKAIRDRGLPLTTATRKFSMNMLIDSYMRSKGFMPHNGHGYVRVDEVDQSVVTNKYSFIYHEHVYGYSDHDLHGFGVNAVSSIREHTITNTSSRQNYINSMMNGKIPMTINKHSKILDEMKALIMRLPYHGEVEKSKIDMINIPLSLQEKISQLKSHKLITEDKERFYLTKLGWYWYTNIMFWLMPESEQIAMKHFVAKHLNTEGKFIAKKELIYV
ncbi:coproporphyrinogen-III oxidase family protein [Gallibacterium anatis]|uniref:coproporphyrinogen-III oxidase family protein n=1 Tax=Gallibacterium anatis TaxID=750 RepID=UPI0005318A6B|nr:radical SAM protein [Gallibacterium anatis]KGQ64312.1 coproporphyrinogen III oxidase [Gallibacterium anatis]